MYTIVFAITYLSDAHFLPWSTSLMIWEKFLPSFLSLYNFISHSPGDVPFIPTVAFTLTSRSPVVGHLTLWPLLGNGDSAYLLLTIILHISFAVLCGMVDVLDETADIADGCRYECRVLIMQSLHIRKHLHWGLFSKLSSRRINTSSSWVFFWFCFVCFGLFYMTLLIWNSKDYC